MSDIVWITTALSNHGRGVTGPMELLRQRPWVTILRVPTEAGSVFFKAVAPVFTFEVPLTTLLAATDPTFLPTVLAADSARGWLLLEDGGEPLRPVLKATGTVTYWEEALPRYACLQQALTARAETLIRMGVPDRRLVLLPTLFRQLLDDRETLLVLSPDEHAALLALTPTIAALCAELATRGIPETIQHDDLHDANVLLKDGQVRLFDWGDACLTHPFFSLLVTLRSTAHTLGCAAADPRLTQLRAVYAAAWGLAADDPVWALAEKLAMLCRALTWYHLAQSQEGAVRDELNGSVSGWLQELLAAMG